MPRLRPSLALAVAAAAVLPVRAAGPDLQTLLDLATAYELKFIGQFENVVAEEVYVQEMSSPRRKRTIRSPERGGRIQSSKTLRSTCRPSRA